MIRAYHFFGDTLRDGSAVPPNGEWLKVDPEQVRLCEYGLHASIDPFDALKYAPGNNLAIVELRGVIEKEGDKIVASERLIVARINAEQLLREFARKCASDVLHLWDAPAVVKTYLETGDETLRCAARDAALDAWEAAGAAGDAARAAAWAAARAARAARDAAWADARAAWAADLAAAWAADLAAASDERRRIFNEMVTEAFKNVDHFA